MNGVDDEPQTSGHGKSPLRTISPETLRESCEAHQVWVSSRGKHGRRADLSETDLGRANLRAIVLIEANLQGTDLERAVLEGAHLQRAELQRANLRGANLQRASLQQANLQGADLFEANLEASVLHDANLQAVNLLEADLRRVDLQRANLQRAFMKGTVLHGAALQSSNMLGSNLQEADLMGADLRRAVLREANLSGANLRGADLQGAELQGSYLQEAILQQAYLRDADLRETTGLVADQLAGADLAGAKLPDSVNAFGGVATVRELTKQARHLFALCLLTCVVSWFCIGVTTDVMILTNARLGFLPDLAFPMRSGTFYRVMPLALLGLFIYFHLHLQRLWENLAVLPAVFPDGRPLDRVVHPWLLHGLIRAYSGRLRSSRPALSRLQSSLCTLMAWWLVPITLLLFWSRYLPVQNWRVTLFHIAIAVIGIAFMVLFRSLAHHTLLGKPLRRYTHGAVAILTALVSNLILSLFSIGALTGVPPDATVPAVAQDTTMQQFSPADPRRLVPLLLTLAGASPFADLRDAEVASKRLLRPGNADRLDLIEGVPLNGANLRYARAQRAFLVNADLRDAILTGADLRFADLRGARLAGADLQRAVLYGADLRYASGLTQPQLDAALTDATTRLPMRP